jgi:hypothetical protein
MGKSEFGRVKRRFSPSTSQFLRLGRYSERRWALALLGLGGIPSLFGGRRNASHGMRVEQRAYQASNKKRRGNAGSFGEGARRATPRSRDISRIR